MDLDAIVKLGEVNDALPYLTKIKELQGQLDKCTKALEQIYEMSESSDDAYANAWDIAQLARETLEGVK